MQNANKREVCYSARDEYFQCIEETGDLESCQKQLKAFEGSCPGSWVSYFQKQRERELMIESQVGRARARLGRD